MDLVLAQGNIALTKKIKKAYVMNRHFQNTWVVKLAWGVKAHYRGATLGTFMTCI
jgi:hypothetical protein